MKKLFYLAISLILCFSMCNDKEEECANGYEGDDCNVEIRAKFYGTYFGTLTGAGESQSISTMLTTFIGNIEKITWDQRGYLVLSGSNTFNIPNQMITDSGITMTINGNGSLNGDILTMTFKASMSGVSVDFTFLGTKQKSIPTSKDASLWVKVENMLLKAK